MTPEKDKQLVEKYPKIFVGRRGKPSETLMCFGFECGDGWFDLIDRLCQKLQELSDSSDNQAVALQVKEKFGGLRFYIGTGTNEQFDAISTAENESYDLCEKCGASPAKTTRYGWMKTLCEQHWPEGEPWDQTDEDES